MMYAEGTFIMLAAPFLALLFIARAGARRILFCLVVGMLVCLVGAYINTYISFVWAVDDLDAVVLVAPMVEEIAKYLPLAFYFLVFEPPRRNLLDAALAIGAGFAIFENATYLSQGIQGLGLLALRGVAAGAMHSGVTAFVGLALSYTRDKDWPRGSAMAGVLSLAVIYHALYNLLVSFPGPLRYVGFALPMLFALGLGLSDWRGVKRPG
ncbi:MAG: PrsW family intramembrane metalloprotease [Clostridiales bacterium]|jgi:RsiW-degrading membrane proteinase PrsW (M82 family)|nr:PrsW family intramembrane metalloprotease [Clostridiales bacterium]